MKIALLNDEEVRYYSRKSPAFLIAFSVLFVFLCLLPYFLTESFEIYSWEVTAIFLVLCFIVYLSRVIMYLRTVLVVTNKRVIYMHNSGKIFTQTVETLITKISHLTVSRDSFLIKQVELVSESGNTIMVLKNFPKTDELKDLIWHLSQG